MSLEYRIIKSEAIRTSKWMREVDTENRLCTCVVLSFSLSLSIQKRVLQ